jgi:signal transduction histidine kinase
MVPGGSGDAMAKRKRKAQRKTRPRGTRRTLPVRATKKRVAKKRTAKTRAPRPVSTRAVETALAGIAHDIRTPLTGIVALAELLASSDLGQRERDWADAIKSGADHLAGLTTLIVDAVRADVAGLTLRK